MTCFKPKLYQVNPNCTALLSCIDISMCVIPSYLRILYTPIRCVYLFRSSPWQEMPDLSTPETCEATHAADACPVIMFSQVFMTVISDRPTVCVRPKVSNKGLDVAGLSPAERCLGSRNRTPSSHKGGAGLICASCDVNIRNDKWCEFLEQKTIELTGVVFLERS